MNYQQQTVWIVDDDRSIRWVLEKALEKADFYVKSFSAAKDLLAALHDSSPAAVMTDIRMPGMDGLALLNKIQISQPELPVIVMTAHSDLDSAVSAYQGGAFDYLPKPFDVNEAVELARRACRSRSEHETANTEEDESEEITELPNTDMIGESPAMQDVFRAIGRLSRSRINVLINGESGTGKELVAQALHKHSPRATQPFIALNMAAIPKDLMEAELFGHEKGAFTGAGSTRRGRFEQANKGTLFLDEIGDMPAELQTRLLRVLSDGVFYRVGGADPIQVDVRIVAATHQDLEDRVRQGQFREDLFHRLNVIRIKIPSLRERREDIPALVNHFIKEAAQELGVEEKKPLPEVLDYLMQVEWPGNVRQLQNVCRWLSVMASGREILMQDLPPDLHVASPGSDSPELAAMNAAIPSMPNNISSDSSEWQTLLRVWMQKALQTKNINILDEIMPEFERIVLRETLNFTGGRRQETARILGWGRNTVTRKIKELDLTNM